MRRRSPPASSAPAPTASVFTYQGDGDLAAIGTAETVHAATRGENITIIFVNNAIYGMTGGQMAPTTLPGQVTQTTPYGRDVKRGGLPDPDLRNAFHPGRRGPMPSAWRWTPFPTFARPKRPFKRPLKTSMEGKGFSIVEVLSTCPTNWGLTPVEALQWLRDNMMPYYPLGVYKDITAEGGAGMTDYKIICAGFGGQGILFAGKVLAYAGLMEGKEVSWLSVLWARDAGRHG